MFKTESTSQNFTILFNFLIGALGGTVVFVLRVLEDLVDIGKGIAWILRVIPSFAFSYGYQQLLGQVQLLYIDNKDNLAALIMGNKFDILSTNYFGSDLIYLGVVTIVSIFILFLLEFFTNKISFGNKDNPNPPELLTNDEEVKKESEKLKMLDPTGSEASNYSIVIKNLEKSYGKFKAIQNISFGLNYGECFALLGVNGAGKTTTFKCLTNEVFPSKGHIYIAGKDSIKYFEDIRRLIGYCPQFDALFEYMTVSENLYYYALIKGIHAERRLGMINSIIDEMKLSEQLNKPAGMLSGGNKRKLSVAIAILGNPPIIFLDEPSNGMDPEARRFMWAVIQKISTQRKKSSVILTTHSMEEAETLCRRMGIMVKGRFKCLGTSTGIKDRYGAVFNFFY
jgi:ABC-type multidrug transport system ATPase subunit